MLPSRDHILFLIRVVVYLVELVVVGTWRLLHSLERIKASETSMQLSWNRQSALGLKYATSRGQFAEYNPEAVSELSFLEDGKESSLSEL